MGQFAMRRRECAVVTPCVVQPMPQAAPEYSVPPLERGHGDIETRREQLAPEKVGRFHGDALVVTVAADQQPSFVYFGRSASNSSVSGFAEVSRSQTGAQFDASTMKIENTFFEVEKRPTTMKDGRAGYEYRVHFKKPVAGEDLSGAIDPQKIAVRLGGKDYQLHSEPPTLPVAPPPKERTELVLPKWPLPELAPPPREKATTNPDVTVQNPLLDLIHGSLGAGAERGKPYRCYQVQLNDAKGLHYMELAYEGEAKFSIVTRSEGSQGGGHRGDRMVFERTERGWQMKLSEFVGKGGFESPADPKTVDATIKGSAGGYNLPQRLEWLTSGRLPFQSEPPK